MRPREYAVSRRRPEEAAASRLCWLPFRDVRCGRIQCQGGRERPLLGTSAEILTTTFNHTSLVCRGTFFHLADDVSDPAAVAPGTTCGPGKVRSTAAGSQTEGPTGRDACVCVSGLSRPEVHGRIGIRGGRLSRQV